MSAVAAPIIAAIVPVVFVIALGWIAGWSGAVPRDGSRVLAAFVVKFALPIALFLASAKAKPEEILNLPYLLSLFAGLVGVYAIAYCYARYSSQHEADESAMRALTCSFPNMAYCGPPVLLAAVGPSALLAIVIGNLLVSLLMVPLTLVLLAQHRRATGSKQSEAGVGVGRQVGQAFLKPLVILPALGIAFALLRIQIPPVLASAADEIGRAAGGAALFTLGLILSAIAFKLNREIVANVLLQNVLQPGLFLAVGLAIGLRGDPLKAVFLIGVLPSASENAMLALSSGVYKETAAASVMASTLFSVVTISAGIAIAAGLG